MYSLIVANITSFIPFLFFVIEFINILYRMVKGPKMDFTVLISSYKILLGSLVVKKMKDEENLAKPAPNQGNHLGTNKEKHAEIINSSWEHMQTTCKTIQKHATIMYNHSKTIQKYTTHI